MPLSAVAFDSVDLAIGGQTVLRGASFAVEAGEFVGVLGPNGAGKTTLMRALAGLIPLTHGQVRLHDREISKEPADRRVADGIALVPEGRLVFPDLTVAETLRIGGYVRRARAGWAGRAETMYALFPRLRRRRHSRAATLSGGEQQMLALARGLMSMPRVLLLDEPSLGLAPAMATEIFERLTAIRDQGVAIGLVEQNVHSALSISDYAYVLEDGRIHTEGTGTALMHSPVVRASYLGL